MEKNTDTMGKRIAAHRKRLKLTQDALAQELGVSAQAVSKWENDLSCPDIATLAPLARVFGITVDELLGLEPKADPVHEAEVITDFDEDERGIHFELDSGHKFDISFGSAKMGSIFLAAWFIAMGAMMLAGLFLKVEVGLWSAAWTTGLAVTGAYQMYKRIRFSSVLCTLAGIWFMIQELELIPIQLGWNVLLPVLIVVFGVSLLIDGLTGKTGRFRVYSPTQEGNCKVELRDGFLTYNHAFGDSKYLVSTQELKGGQINVSFCDLELDFSGVETLGKDCRVKVNSSFGDVTLCIPSRFLVNTETSGSFSDIEIQGQPDPNPQGILRLTGNTSFGDLQIEYI